MSATEMAVRRIGGNRFQGRGSFNSRTSNPKKSAPKAEIVPREITKPPSKWLFAEDFCADQDF